MRFPLVSNLLAGALFGTVLFGTVLFGTVLFSGALHAQQPNTLTRQEVEDGWILLWDGASETGWEWHGEANWTFNNGVIKGVDGGYGWLGTTTTFGDFHLRAEFKTAADGNSGIFLRSARGAAAPDRLRAQIYDDQPQGFNTGSLVFYEKAEPAKLIPDVWNSFDILVEGTHFQIVLNNRLVFDGHNATHAAGVIGLQFNPNKPIEFRNLKLRPLNLEPLLDRTTFDGWKPVDRPNNLGDHTWQYLDGVVHVEGGPGQIETEKLFKNLVLQLGIKTNPPAPDKHPNSGVFIRGYPGKFWSGYEVQIRNEYFGGDPTRPVDIGTGGIYFWQPTRRVIPKDGEWFHETIVAYDRHISVWVNGIQVADYEDTKPEGANDRKQANLRAGTISLQAHDPGTDLEFKNLRAAEIRQRPMRLQ